MAGREIIPMVVTVAATTPVVAARSEPTSTTARASPPRTPLRSNISAQDVVFIYARSTEGPPMPIAAMRIPVDQLPYSFSFDDSFSLIPYRHLSDFPAFLIGSSISKSGNAFRASRDIESLTTVVRPGASVELTIDSTVP